MQHFPARIFVGDAVIPRVWTPKFGRNILGCCPRNTCDTYFWRVPSGGGKIKFSKNGIFLEGPVAHPEQLPG